MKHLSTKFKQNKSLNKINKSLNFSNHLFVKLANRPIGRERDRERAIIRNWTLPYGNWAKINICDFELFGCAQSPTATTPKFYQLKIDNQNEA